MRFDEAYVAKLEARIKELESVVATWQEHWSKFTALNAAKNVRVHELEAENKRLREALEHIADKDSRRNCCKFAVLAGHRRRHLKDVARVALGGDETYGREIL